MKRIFSVFLAFIMMTALVGLNVTAAAKSAWDGYTIISSAADLLKMKNSDGRFYLIKDIDLKSYGEWNERITFRGTLDGNGYCVKNLTSSEYGLFYSLSGATVRNLGITDTEIISADGHVGALTRKCVNTKVDNCYVTGHVESTAPDGVAAGLVGFGYNNGGNTLTNCVNMADIVGYEACGLCCSDETDVFEHCVNYGTVSGGKYAGGICCALGTTMKSCFSLGEISTESSDGKPGGLAGKAGDSAVMLNCATSSPAAIGRASKDCAAQADEGISKSKFKKPSTYDFDFGKTWAMSKKVNSGYPVLAIMLRNYNGSKPVASNPAGSYKNSVRVELTTDIEGGVIRYTTDGKTPTASSSKYTKPLTFKKDTTVKAAVFVNGVRAKVVTLKYTIK